MKRCLMMIAPAILSAVLIGCAAEPNDFPPRPTNTPGEILPGPTFAPSQAPQPTSGPQTGGGSSGGVIVSTSPVGEGTAVAPPAPATVIIGGSGAANGTAIDLTQKPGPSTPQPTRDASQGGQIDLTYADNNSTVVLKVGQSFLLKLNPDLKWNVSIEDPAIIVQAQTFAAIPGAQGMYIAAKAGQTEFSAVGTANCPAGQACPMFAILFKVTLVVK